jgi:hypothetical protein
MNSTGGAEGREQEPFRTTDLPGEETQKGQ